MNKKKLVSLCLVLALAITAAIGGTMAYFTDYTDTAENTFTVGNVDIELDEADVDENGVVITDGQGNVLPRVTENDYKLFPGHTYVKDPTVTVQADSEEAYIRMLVTINKQGNIDSLFAGKTLDYILKGYDANEWKYIGYTKDEENDTRTYEFRYKKTVNTLDGEAEVLAPLFTQIVIPGELTNAQMALLNGLEIDVVAEAIQADGFETADAAWDAYKLIPETDKAQQ